MRSSWFIVIIAVVFSIYASINYYIGYRGWQAFGGKVYLINSKVYWVIFWAIAFSFIIARITQKFLPNVLGQGLNLIGSYWMAAMVYFIILLVIIDVIRLMDKWLSFIPEKVRTNPSASLLLGLIVLCIVIATLVYGTWNARNPIIKHYQININKKAGSLTKLHAVMVSDIHLGTMIGKERLEKMVKQINQLKPDIILIPGDVIDEDIKVVMKQDVAPTFRKLKSKFGTYAVFGNHENIGRAGNVTEEYLQQGGINVLRDSYVKIKDSFYVVGRNDLASGRFGGGRKSLSNLLQGVDTSLPIILLDHQPAKLNEPEENSIDLQLSGHTHRGQFFPLQYITKAIYEDDYGYLLKNNFQLIVTSGYGTWGPPIRVGNSPEIVDIIINFTKK